MLPVMNCSVINCEKNIEPEITEKLPEEEECFDSRQISSLTVNDVKDNWLSLATFCLD